jgi:hypothetical protein
MHEWGAEQMKLVVEESQKGRHHDSNNLY